MKEREKERDSNHVKTGEIQIYSVTCIPELTVFCQNQFPGFDNLL